MDKQKFFSFLSKVPKAELHIHIEAVISRNTIKTLYLKKNNSELSDTNLKKLFNYSDLNGFIKASIQVQDLFTSEDDFNLVFSDLKDYLLRNGITYCEAFFSPSAFIKKGFSYIKMTEIFERNISLIKKETGITVRLLGDVSRTFGVKNAQKNLDMFLENRFDAFIGIGLGGAEKKGPARKFGHIFEKALSEGLHAVAHAGEDVGPQSIRDAINICHAERIGHGITAVNDEELMNIIAERQIPMELAPMSNVFTKKFVSCLEDHPFRIFFDRGILVTLNTDDPLFFGVELIDEYWHLYTKMHFSMEEIKQVIKNSFTASFMNPQEKEKAIQSVDEKWQTQ